MSLTITQANAVNAVARHLLAVPDFPVTRDQALDAVSDLLPAAYNALGAGLRPEDLQRHQERTRAVARGLFVEDDADDDPTIWVHDPARPDAPFALLRRFDLESQLCIARHDHRDAVREAIVAVWQRLTAGLPTSAPAVTP